MCVCMCHVYGQDGGTRGSQFVCWNCGTNTPTKKHSEESYADARFRGAYLCVFFCIKQHGIQCWGCSALVLAVAVCVCVRVSGVSQIGNGWKLNGNQQKKTIARCEQ